MNISQIKKTLPTIIKHHIVPFLWGYQGVGKTQVVSQIASELGMDFVHLHLATQEVGDLVGLLKHNADGTVSHSRPEWFPTTGPCIIFLDELNRAHPDVLQAMFSLITSKTIHTHRLPKDCYIVAAGNYQSSEFTVTDTSDVAWTSRFCHIEFEPTVEEFVVYAQSVGKFTVSDFISEQPSMLEVAKRDKVELNITPDRRAWNEGVAVLETEDLDDSVRYELYSGLVGSAAASAFMAFKKQDEKRIRLRDILLDYGSVKKKVSKLSNKSKTRFDILNSPIEELVASLNANAAFLTTDAVENLGNFLCDLPLELLSQTVRKLHKVDFEHKGDLLNSEKLLTAIKSK